MLRIRAMKATSRLVVALGAFLSAQLAIPVPAAVAQEVPDVITPPEVTTDPNGLNLMTGQMMTRRPKVSVPAAPRLTFSRASDFLMYAVGQRNDGSKNGHYSIHYGGARSESFDCQFATCTPRNSNSGFSAQVNGPSSLTREKTRERYRFDVEVANWVDNITNINHTEYYASSVAYPDGEDLVIDYDPTHYRVSKVQSSTGYFLELTYWDSVPSGSAWVKTATIYANADPATPLSRLSYSSDGTQATDLAGRTWTCGAGCGHYSYANPWVTADTLELPDESATSLSYTANPSYAFLMQTINQDGVNWTYSYSGVQSQYFVGALASYRFSSVQVAGPDGYERTYQLQTHDYGIYSDNRYEIQYIESSIDELNRLTAYSYEPYKKSHRLTGITYPEGNSVHFEYDSAGNIIRRTDQAKAESGLSNLVQTAEYSNWRPVWYRDAKNNQTDFVYNPQTGLLEQQLDPADSSGIRQRTIIEYEAHTTPYRTVVGQGPNGPITIAQIIHRKKKVRVCGVRASNPSVCVTNEPSTTYDYFGHTFLPSVATDVSPADELTRTTSYTYDGAGRVLSINGPLPGNDDTTFFRYDPVGRKTWEISELTPDGYRLATKTTYRPADDKVTKVESGTIPNADSSALTVLKATETTYDSRRNPIRERLYSGTTTFSVTDRSFLDRGLAQCTTSRMNLASLPGASATGACNLGTEASLGPDRITKNIYDAAGQLLQVRSAVSTSIESAEVTYTYTANGKQRFVIDANGNKAELRYDGHDRQARWVFPSITRPSSFNDATPATAVSTAGALNESDYESYTWDANGNRLSLRKRDGSTLTYLYDPLNRMTRKTVPERADLASIHTRNVHYTYDHRGLQTSARFGNTTGQGSISEWDGFGRLVSLTDTIDAKNRTLTYEYDNNGNRTRITNPDAAFFTYSYDALSRLNEVANSASQTLITAAYDAHGLLGSATRFGSAHNQSFSYDTAGRLSGLGISGGGTSAPAVSWSFTRNPAGQILTDTRDNDAYRWDGHINTNRNYTANGLNQYTSAGPASFCYDANGNLTADGSSAYLYDIENRLVERHAQTNSNCSALSYAGTLQAELRYDTRGRLYFLRDWVGSNGITRFLYDGDAMVAEYDNGTTLFRRYLHGSNIAADDPLVWFEGTSTDAGAGTTRHLYADPRGSIVLAGTPTGSAFATNAYDEYGIPAASNQGRFQYTGQAWISELGMYHYKARLYSPTLGRFLQSDPIGYEDQFNLYAYVANDPINNTDPTGEVLDTIVDVGFLIYDGYKIATEGATPENVAAAGADAVAILVPFATGAGMVVRGGSKASDAVRAADNATDAARARPSTLQPGPNARESIPGQRGRPSASQQREINRIGDRDGCHTCGSRESGRRSGNWTADHQPSNGRNSSGQPQRLYPHCAGCSARQGAEVRNANRRTPPPPQPRLPRRPPED